MKRLANVALGAAFGCLAFSIVYLALHPHGGLSNEDAVFDIIVIFAACAFGILGRLIVGRAHNRIGFVFLALALGGALTGSTDIALKTTAAPYPALLGWVGVLTIVGLMLTVAALTILLLIFPTGTVPSPRWRWAWWLWITGVVAASLASLLGVFDLNTPGLQNPIGVHGTDLLQVLGNVGGIALVAVVAVGIASLVARSRRGDAEVKAQVRWLALIGGLALVGFLLAGIGESIGGSSDAPIAELGWLVFILSLIIGVPAAVAISVLKYRLYEIDVVVSRAIVFGGLVLFITLVYAVIVAGVGAVIGSQQDRALSIAATIVVAVLFQPLRDRMRRFANRVVYGERATPYDVLARFSERVGGSYAAEDVLPRTARVIAEGIGAARVEIWLRLGDTLSRDATWPASDGGEAAVTVRAEELPPLHADRTVAVRRQDRLLGAIAVTKPRNEPFTPQDVNLVDRLAEQSALVLANVGLTADLESRLAMIKRQAAALQASRQRIVAAQDEERRQLERNIHDGAQQHLVALAVKLRLAKATLAKDPARGQEMLVALREQADDALETLQSLSLGVYPPLLEDQGIAAALAAQYMRTHLPVHLATPDIGRYPIEIEAAVYFCVLEALQNAAKYADADRIDVILAEEDHAVTFEVRDDGSGFDTAADGNGTGLHGIRDRLAVFGGDASIASAPGAGTTVRGRIPISAAVPV